VLLGCGRIHYQFVGDLEAVVKKFAPRLHNTPFGITEAYDDAALVGRRLPVWEALRRLGLRSLPDRRWAEGRAELEPWYVLDPPPGRAQTYRKHVDSPVRHDAAEPPDDEPGLVAEQGGTQQ